MMGNEKVAYVYEFQHHLLALSDISQPFGRGRYFKNYGMCWEKKYIECGC